LVLRDITRGKAFWTGRKRQRFSKTKHCIKMNMYRTLVSAEEHLFSEQMTWDKINYHHISNGDITRNLTRRDDTAQIYMPGRGGQDTPRKIRYRCADRPLSKTLTLCMTKIRDFPYPIYDLAKNLMPYWGPDPYINALFQTCLIITSSINSSDRCYKLL